MTTSPSNLDLTKPVQTRDGRKARIICTDRKGGNYPVLALVTYSHNQEDTISFTTEDTVSFTTEGHCFFGNPGAHDLVNVPVTVRVCLFPNSIGDYCSQTLKNEWTEEKCKRTWGEENCTFHNIVLDT